VGIPDTWRGPGTTWLCFGAVEWSCTFRVDGMEVGRHEGGWLPFAFEIGDPVRPGEANRLTVEVADAEGALFAETPHGKQSWYVPLAGIACREQGVRGVDQPWSARRRS
jgi:hypothetical protein